MRTSKPWFSAAIIAIAAVLFAAPTPSHADTYQVFDLGSIPPLGGGVPRDPLGIEASGAVVVYVPHEVCGTQTTFCFETWVNGSLVGKSTTNPDPVYDNGTGCIPNAPAAFSGYTTSGVCNSGREVYGTEFFAPDPYESSIFTGPDPVTDFFGNGLLDEAFLNSSGDFVIVESRAPHEGAEIYQVIDLTTSTPEPSSIIFLGTGVFAAVGTMRRRLLQQG